MADPAKTVDQNLLPVQAYFNLDGSFNTFIGQGQPFYATSNPVQSGLTITNSTLDSSPIGSTSPSTGVFTNITTTTGTISTTASNATDIANKFYVDTVAQGLGPKAACQVATTTNITLSGLQTIDGYTTLAGDRVLVKNQTTSSQNGIYIASSSTWLRSADMDVWAEVPGAYTVILNGGQSNTGWVSTASQTGIINVTAMPWVQFSGTSTYYAGTGLSLASNTFSITNTGVSAATYGSASIVPVIAVNAQGQITSATNTTISIAPSQINATIPNSGLTNSSITINGSAIALGGSATITAVNPFALTIGTGLTGTSYNGSVATTIAIDSTVVTLSGTQTLTNKTLTSPVISTITNTGTLTLPTSTDTLVGRATTDTLTNKSISGSTNTITNIGNSSLTNSSITLGSTSISLGSTASTITALTLANPTISNYQAFTASSAPTYTAGLVWYDSTTAALSYYNSTTNNVVHIGQELQQQARNSTGSTITKGSVVYISGATGQIGNITLAQANSYAASQVIGVANQDIPNNTNGWIVTQGTVTNFNTSGLTEGANIYLSATTAGALTSTEPSTPNYAVHMGTCLYSNSVNGKIYINPINKSIDTGYIIGQVAIGQGGTNSTATPTAGAIAYGTGTAYAFNSAGTTGQVLTSQGTSAPIWANNAATVSITDDTTSNLTYYPLVANQTTGQITTEYTSSTKLKYNPSTGTLTATVHAGGAAITSGNIDNTVIGNTTPSTGKFSTLYIAP